MTTTERPSESSAKPRYLTDEYEIVRDGRTFRCRLFEYRGDEYESCYEVGATKDVLREIIPEPLIGPDNPIYHDLVAYLDQFLIEPEEPTSE